MTIDKIINDFLFEPSIIIGNLSYVLALVISSVPFKKKKAICLAEFCVLFLLSFLLTFLLPLIPIRLTIHFYLKYLILGLFYLLYNYLMTKANLKALFISFYCTYGMAFLLGELGGSLPLLVRDMTFGKEVDTIIRNLITGMEIPYSLLLNKFPFKKIKNIPLPTIAFSSLLCIGEVGITFYSTYYIHINTITLSLYQFIIFFFLILTNIVSYIMMYKICFANQERIKLQAKNYELEKNQELLMVSDQNLEKLRELKHDSKNQYAYMKILLEEKRYDDLERFFQEYGDGILEPLSFIHTKNPIISSILNMEYAKARALKVDFDCKTALPASLPILATDLTSLLCNLLDNAIRGAKESSKNPTVTIRLREYQKFFYIDIRNPVKDGITLTELETIKTTKEDKNLHGFGRKIISSIIKKYNGTKNVSINESIYSIKIMLSYPEEEMKEENENEHRSS